MRVEVRVFATLRRYLPDLGIGEPKLLDIPAGTTLDEIRVILGLPAEEVQVIMVNHLQVDPEVLAADGDRITYIPAVAGG